MYVPCEHCGFDTEEDCKNCHLGILEMESAAYEKKLEHLYTHLEVAEWLAEYHGKYRELTLTDWVARKRAEKKG
jgi:hypothetical protein